MEKTEIVLVFGLLMCKSGDWIETAEDWEMKPLVLVAWIHLLISGVVVSTVRPALAQARPEVITNSLGGELVLVPAGEFDMGAEEDKAAVQQAFKYCDPRWLEGEAPQHRVRITKPFYMARHEVTLGQFRAFCDQSPYTVEIERDGRETWGYGPNGKGLVRADHFRPWEPGWKIRDDHPAVYVSWNDAVAFCKWLSEKDGRTYRLPTEAEWEYACRAGSKSRYSFGDDPERLVQFGNVADRDQKETQGIEDDTAPTYDARGKRTGKRIPFPFLAGRDGHAWTAPVGERQPNAFGLYDMHGNVWEWCSDWYDKDYYQRSPVDDPQGPTSGAARVMRGGGFTDTPVWLRCAFRSSAAPSNGFGYAGFRLVCEK